MRFLRNKVLLEDVENLCKMKLRDIDLLECSEVGCTDPEEALRDSIESSLGVFCEYVIDSSTGDTVCIYGVGSSSSTCGMPWMLCSRDFEPDREWALRSYKEVIPEILKVRPTLFNWIHKDNKTSMRWLEQGGFTLEESIYPNLLFFYHNTTT